MDKYDIAVIGGSLGGTLAALSACKQGKRVLLTEQSIWIGGQLTSQAVPPDEHKWIERTGATATYMQYRNQVRQHYRQLPNIAPHIKDKQCFCPGGSWVSRLAHHPKVALGIFNSYLQPYIDNKQLTIMYTTIAVHSVVVDDTIVSVTVKNTNSGQLTVVEAEYFLDATDCGDLLPIVNAEYRTGAESRDQFGEPLAPIVADSQDMQPITWVVAVELVDNDDYAMEKPEQYDYFASIISRGGKALLSWFSPSSDHEQGSRFSFYNGDLADKPLGLFTYRRIVAQSNYIDKVNEVSLINWPQNDYSLGNIYDCDDAEHHKYMARQLSLSTVYWLQNYAQRADGGVGYPVKLCQDVFDTVDGLALMPYIRESRRIVGLSTIRQQDVSAHTNSDFAKFDDSVGVGHYCIDLHSTTKTATSLYDKTVPFEIPLSAMIPIRLNNLLPSCKNISCTHLTNGCYRLHPIEWNIGEVAGYLAAYCIDNNITPQQVLHSHLRQFQQLLEAKGIQLHWNKEEMI